MTSVAKRATTVATSVKVGAGTRLGRGRQTKRKGVGKRARWCLDARGRPGEDASVGPCWPGTWLGLLVHSRPWPHSEQCAAVAGCAGKMTFLLCAKVDGFSLYAAVRVGGAAIVIVSITCAGMRGTRRLPRPDAQ